VTKDPPQEKIPARAHDLRLGEQLTQKEKDQLLALLLSKFSDLFADGKTLSHTHEVQHRVPTGDSPPVHAQPRRVPPAQRSVIENEVQVMLKNGIIEPSASPWSSPVVLVKKKDGSVRFCVDYRKLNSVTKRDVYPLPRIDDAIDALAGAQYFSTLDLLSGYWQIEMDPNDKEKTAFCTPGGLYQFKRMPFGLANAPATFQRLMDKVLRAVKYRMALVYLDDIIIYSPDFKTHMQHLEEVLTTIQSAGLRLKAKKCTFAAQDVVYLGHRIAAGGISPDPEKIRAVRGLVPPSSLKELRSFLGLASYYRRFIKDFAKIAAPLYDSLSDKSFAWTADHQRIFIRIKEAITSEPVLDHFHEERETRLQTDASGSGLGAVLVQMHEGKERVVAFASRRLSKAEEKCHSSETECLAVVWAIKKFHPYLYGRPFKVVTDSIALKYLRSKANLSPKLVRWALELQEYDFEILHRSGTANGNADALSRLTVATIDSEALLDEEVRAEQESYARSRSISEKLARGETVGDYHLTQGLLFYRGKLYIPPALREKAMKLCHEASMAGHPGIYKTERRLRERFYIGPKAVAQVAKFIKRCRVCQCRKPASTKVGSLQPVSPPVRPFAKVGMDFMGPLNVPGQAALFVLVLVDYCTRFVQLFPARSISASVVRRSLEVVQSAYGQVGSIITDNASCFRSRALKDFLTANRIEHFRSAVGHPQSNGLAERTIRTVTERLGSLVAEGKTSLRRALPKVAFSINTTTSESLQATPFELLHGFKAVLPGEPSRLPVQPQVPVTELRAEAHRQLEKAQERMKAKFDLKSSPAHSFEEGAAVLMRLKRPEKGLSEKLRPRFIGPATIVRRVAHQTYEVRTRDGRKRILNAKDLRPHAGTRG
jgi:hypothetical protein